MSCLSQSGLSRTNVNVDLCAIAVFVLWISTSPSDYTPELQQIKPCFKNKCNPPSASVKIIYKHASMCSFCVLLQILHISSEQQHSFNVCDSSFQRETKYKTKKKRSIFSSNYFQRLGEKLPIFCFPCKLTAHRQLIQQLCASKQRKCEDREALCSAFVVGFRENRTMVADMQTIFKPSLMNSNHVSSSSEYDNTRISFDWDESDKRKNILLDANTF